MTEIFLPLKELRLRCGRISVFIIVDLNVYTNKKCIVLLNLFVNFNQAATPVQTNEADAEVS